MGIREFLRVDTFLADFHLGGVEAEAEDTREANRKATGDAEAGGVQQEGRIGAGGGGRQGRVGEEGSR